MSLLVNSLEGSLWIHPKCHTCLTATESQMKCLYQKSQRQQYALQMSREVEVLYMNKFVKEVSDKTSFGPKELTVLDDWYFVQGNSDNEMGGWEVVSKDQIKDVHQDTNPRAKGFLLKMSGLIGPVRGLAFNNQYSNMLAAAAQGDRLNIYDIDSTTTYEFTDGLENVKNAQVTFLEWHPQYPAILASTTDVGTTTIWDIRKKKPGVRVEQKGENSCEVHWQPDNVLRLATASNGNHSSDPVKIWDLSRPLVETHKFGPSKGVNSLSWSAAHNLILTTDIDGGEECWKLNKQSADPCGLHTTAASY